MQITIYVLCGDSTYNRGDRGNLSAQLNLLRSRFPDAHLVVDSYRPEVDRVWYDAEIVHRGKFLSLDQIRHLRRADVVVWGGGALLADNASRIKIPYWLVIIGFIKGILRKPIMAWAQGLIIDSRLGSHVGKRVLNAVDLITVRDESSFQTLERIGATRPPRYTTADPAVLVRPSSAEAGERVLEHEGINADGRPLFAFANTFCPFHYDPGDLIPHMIAEPLGLRKGRGEERIQPLKRNLARTLDMLIEKYGCHVLLLPTYPAPWENDLEHFEDMIRMASHKEHISCLIEDIYSPGDYLALWHHLSFLLSIPMHHSIFSTVMGVPCVGLAYEPKVKDFFRAIDAENRVLDVNVLYEDDGPQKILKVIDYTLSNWDTLRQRTRSNIEAIQARARQNVDYLATLVQEQGLL